MNWGKGIIAGMIVFMLFILGMCFYMFAAPIDDYDHQYYEKGLTYNQYYNKEMQVIKDHAQPVVKISGDYIFIKFKNPATGTLHLQRPSNNSLDKTYRFDSGESSEVQICIKSITKGRWQMLFDWQTNQKAYTYQQVITLK
jgi:hypothetical protein